MDSILHTVLRVVWMDRDLFLRWGKLNGRGRKIEKRKKQVRERDNKAVEMIVELLDNRSGGATDYSGNKVYGFVETVFDIARNYNWAVDFITADEWDMKGNLYYNFP